MSDLPEGHDSAEHIQKEAISPAEILRLRRARAVAKRSIMMDMAHLCDRLAKQIEAVNPGRRKGSVSHYGMAMAAVAKKCGDMIEEERKKIGVPDQ